MDIKAVAARAAPFIDVGDFTTSWKPSEMLVIGWCAIATARDTAAADEFATTMLDEARRRWTLGLPANPFTAPPVA